MKRINKTISIILYVFVGIIILSLCVEPKVNIDKPNIIFILTDDLGYADIGCFGATDIRTPHIDKLAESGIILSSLYTTASVCTPSRAALMTGRYPKRSNLHKSVLQPFKKGGLEPKEFTIAEQLIF